MGCASSISVAPETRTPKGRRGSESGAIWSSLTGGRLQRRGSSSASQRSINVDAANNRFDWQGIWQVPNTLFADASDDCCQEVAKHLRPKHLRKGEILFREGDAGTSMYFINQSRVRVLRNSTEIAVLGVGHYIGELGLMLNDGRTATIMAECDDCELLELSREDFYQVSILSH